MTNLNDLMEFDCVVRVTAGGKVEHANDIYAPDLHDGELETRAGPSWTATAARTDTADPSCTKASSSAVAWSATSSANPGLYVTLVNYLYRRGGADGVGRGVPPALGQARPATIQTELPRLFGAM